MLTVLDRIYHIETSSYHLHINFPGGTPIDGPSAGTAIVTAVYSAITGTPVSGLIAMTGEISIHGKVMPVGGVCAKVSAAKEAGIKTVFIPKDNRHDMFKNTDIEVIPVEHISEIFDHLFSEASTPLPLSASAAAAPKTLISAQMSEN